MVYAIRKAQQLLGFSMECATIMLLGVALKKDYYIVPGIFGQFNHHPHRANLHFSWCGYLNLSTPKWMFHITLHCKTYY
jgi:hypothetical protein